MLLKYCILAFVIFSAVNCQNNLRVRRQGIKGGRQPSPSYVTQQKTYGPDSSVGAPQRQRPFPRPQPRPSEDEGQVNSAEGEANPEPPVYGGVMGTPGVDFPAYGQIPKTNFKCSDVPYEPGMYADQETQCQAYHVCFQGRKESFLCGVGTVFNQAILACDYWHSVECSQAPNFYSVNEELGKAGPEPGPGQPRPAAPRPSSPQQRPYAPRPQPGRPFAPRPQPGRPPVPSDQRPQYEEPDIAIDEPEISQPRPQPRPQPGYQPPASKVQPAFQQRPSYRPPASKVQPARPQRPYAPQPGPYPQPQQRPQISPPGPSKTRPYQPQPYQPQPQQRPQGPYPQPQPRPYQPQPIGKPSLPRPRPSPIEPQIVQTKDEEPVDDSWLAREPPQRQQSGGY